MTWTTPPTREERIARRLIERHNLEVPIDVRRLALLYANVREVAIPFPIDGVCRKNGHTRPSIIINTEISSHERRRFTLAHELGHAIIPWHAGVIVDENTELSQTVFDPAEGEANRFAAELLMPSHWVSSLAKENSSPFEFVKQIAQNACVSIAAATRKMRQHLPPGYMFVKLADGLVAEVFTSSGTWTTRPLKGSEIDIKMPHPRVAGVWTQPTASGTSVWWYVPQIMEIPAPPSGEDLKFILDSILRDIIQGEVHILKRKQSMNGIIAGINGMLRGDRIPQRMYARLHDRFNEFPDDDVEMRSICSHDKFQYYLSTAVRKFIPPSI